MSYQKRDWYNTGNEVTKDDFKRIEDGVEANDLEIAKQKNPTIPGTLAKQIADNVTAIEENANKINVLKEAKFITSLDEITESIKYKGVRIENSPVQDFIIIDATVFDSTWKVATAYTLNLNLIWHGVYRNSVWTWQPIGTTKRTIIKEYHNSWSPWASSYHLRLDVIGGRCFCSGILAIGIKDNGTVICTIPEEFRPTIGLEPRILSGNGNNLQVTIGTNGAIVVDTSASTPWSNTTSTLLDFTCSWEV